MLSETRPATESEGHETSVHDGQLLRTALQPPLGPKLVGIGAPNVSISMHNPGVDANVRASWEICSANGRAAGGDFSP